jgi:ribosomal protein S18 acetylase RimI-like enzyme
LLNDPPMLDEVSVRRANEQDLEEVGRLAARLVRDHHEADPERFFRPEQVESGYAWWLGQELGNRGAVVMVAERGGRVVGYTYSALRERDWNMLIDEHAMLHDIFVLETERRGGIGRKLLTETLNALEALGARRIVLNTRNGNEAAERLFAALGFRRTMHEMMRTGR